MSLLVRLALAIGIGLLAGGTTVAPHDAIAGWTHEGVDHPPSAVHATLLQHLQWLVAERDGAAPSAAASFASAPASMAIGALTLALFAFRAPRPWRPARLGVSWPVVVLADEQRARIAPHAPPRPSFS